MTEHVLLTLASGAVGLSIGSVALHWMGTIDLEHLSPGADVRVDGVIVAYTAAIALVVGVLLGAIPVIAERRQELVAALRAGRTGTSGRGARTLRRALVVTQVSVASILLVASGLLFASFSRVLAVQPGFDPNGILTASVNLPETRYGNAAAIQRFSDETLRAVRSAPGVVSAGATSSIPLGTDFSTGVILAEGYQMSPGESPVGPYRNVVTPGYFETMRVRLVRGRFFDERDRADTPRVVVVDKTLANRFWPGADPIGRRMYLPTDPRNPLQITETTPRLTVVGVVDEVKLRGLVEGVGNIGAYYFPQAQAPERRLTLVVRTSLDPSSTAGVLRNMIAKVDSELAVFAVQTMTERASRSLVSRRSTMLLSIGFAAVALFLSAVGIYAVLAFLVVQRTREICIRIALGAPRFAVFGLILREGVLLIGSGFVIGAVGTAVVSRTLQSQLFGVSTTDPVVLSAAMMILALVALMACVLPAFRATRIAPIIALGE